MKRLTHTQYAEALAKAHPNYELLSEYTNGRSKVTVRCCEHQQTFNVVAKSLTTTGQSLMCCGKARQHVNSREKGLTNLSDRIDAKGRLKLISTNGYTSNRSKVLCECLTCGEQHLIDAANAYSGQGLNCSCREIVRSKAGKTAWSIDLVAKAVAARLERGYSSPYDSVDAALKGEVLPGTCDLYLYESPIQGLSKFGIAKNPEKRSKQDGYGKQLVAHRSYASRVTAVLIEQAYKYSYAVKPPAELSDWCGRTELTDASPAEFQARIDELEQALQALGPEAFADEYTGYRV